MSRPSRQLLGSAMPLETLNHVPHCAMTEPAYASRSVRSFRRGLNWTLLFPILSVLHHLQAFVLRSIRWWGWRKVRPNSALALEVTSTSVGNLGDQAMMGGLAAILQMKGIRDVGIVTYGPQNPWTDVDGTHHAFALNRFSDNLLLMWRMSGYERFFYLGADVMDGAYSATMVRRVAHLLKMADKLGLEATVCGFSFNKDPEPLALEYIRQLPHSVRLCCRDLPSQRRLQTCLGRDVELVADVAFNLPPDDSSETVQNVVAWISQQRDINRQVIGVNLHDQLVRLEQGIAAQSCGRRSPTVCTNWPHIEALLSC